MIERVEFRPFFDDDSDDPRALLGTVEILGQDFHVQAVRVHEHKNGGQVVPFLPDADGEDPVGDDIRNMLGALYAVEGCATFQTVELPGRAGEWVLWIVPHAD